MTTRDFWSTRVLEKAGVFYPSTISPSELVSKIARLNSVRNWVWGHALPRLLMGSFRYEGREADGKSYDQKAREGLTKTYCERIQDKAGEYIRTGNQEMLVDIYNYVILEIMRPTHPNPHFKSTERHE